MTREPQDSAGRPIGVGDRVSWRGQIYTIKAFGDAVGRYGTRTIEFEEPLHIQDEVPDEIAVDVALFDHSANTVKHFEPLLGYCVCAHCKELP